MGKMYTLFLKAQLLAMFPLGAMAQTRAQQASPQTVNTIYSQSFDTEADFNTFSIEDADGDGTKWSYDAEGQTAKYKYSSNYGYRCSDYLITPELNLKAGTKYTLSFFIKGEQGYSSISGEYSALLGQGDDPTKFDAVVPVTQIKQNKGGLERNEKKDFTVEKDGTYRLAFRISNEDGMGCDRMTVNLDNISVIAASASSPAAVSNLTVTPDVNGDKATITFKAPEKAINNEALTAIGKIEVYRGETLIKSITSPAPGSVQTVVDESPITGLNTYKVIPYSTDGSSGEEASTTVWVGKDTPEAVSNLNLTRTEDGKALISWTAPAKGVNGGVVDLATLTYQVTRFPDNIVVSKGKHETSFTDNIDLSKRNIYYYTVKAINGDLESKEVSTEKVFLGKAYELPYSESFDTDPKDRYTIIDANGDGATWKWDSSAKAMTNDYEKYKWNPADDWLLSPTIKLEKGWVYNISFGTAGSSDNADQIEKLSVSIGKGGNVSSFKEVVPTMDVHGTIYSMVSKNVNITEDGDYQLGFHVTSDPIKWGVWVDSIQVKKFVCVDAPDSVTAIKVTPAERGKLEATVAFKTPGTTVDGRTLASISKVEVYRTDAKATELKLVKTFDKPKTSADLSFVDDSPVQGFNIYIIRAINAEGERGIGISNVAKQYIGEDVPFAPTDIVDKDNYDGTVTLTWKAPAGEKGENGKYVNPDQLKYNIYIGETGLVATTEPGVTTATLKISNTGNQAPLRYHIYAQNAAGQSEDYAESNEIMVGGYANLPFRESFKGGGMDEQWWADHSETNLTGTYSLSSDGDGASYSFMAFEHGSWFTFESGKIRTEDAVNPRLAFSYYTTYENNPSIEVFAVTPDHRELKLKTVDIAQDLDWHRVTVDIPQVSSEKYVRLLFCLSINGAYPSSTGVILLDNIDMREMRDYDLAVERMETPYKVTAGQSIDVKASVENFGLNVAEEGDYNVELYVNGEKVMEREGETIQPDETKVYTFSYPTLLNSEKPFSIYTKINYISDLRPDNDASETASVNIIVPGYTKVDDLAAADGKLTWSVPDDMGKKVSEDFESYEYGAIDGYDPWVAYDFDNRLTVANYLGKQGGLPYNDQPIAFQIFNPVRLGLNLDYNEGARAHSGNQYMVSWGGFDDNNYKIMSHDDMLVSPELSGMEQTVTFWVRSMYARWDRAFDFLTSTTSSDADAFDLDNPLLHDVETPIDAENDVFRWDEWTEYNVTVPSGTKYFAIRAYGIDMSTPDTYQKPGMMFMLDDVEYNVPSPAITGYNVYEDDKKVGTVKASEPTEFDAEPGHRYNVTVLYADGGESAYSNDASLGTSSIDKTAENNSCTVAVVNGTIVVCGYAGESVKVYSAAGALIFSGSGDATIPVASGQYIVCIGNKTTKVAVSK